MSGTLTVKEFIKELLDCDMDDEVFIQVGDDEMNVKSVVCIRAGLSRIGMVRIVPQYKLAEVG